MIDREIPSTSAALMAKERLLLDYGVDTAKIMVCCVAHDFNNLIAVVRGYASVLQGRPVLDQDSRELVGLIEQAGSELAALTEQMAKFADTRDSDFSWYNLNSVISEIVNEDRDQSTQGIEVESKLNDDVPELWGDPQLIGDMCQKLWLNALDSVADGGRITFETRLRYYDDQKQNRNTSETSPKYYDDQKQNKKTNIVKVGSPDSISSNGADGQTSSLTNGISKTAYALLRVTDTGEGMDEKTRLNMLRPFFTTKAGRGRGMGATVVYETVKSHGGHLHVTSELGKGTSVEIYLPLPEGNKDQPVEENNRSNDCSYDCTNDSSIETHRATLLVVDDDDMVRVTIQRMLAHLGYDAITATSGEEALALFEASRQDISGVIMDVTMPGLGGVGTFHRLREIDGQVKIVVSSGDLGSLAVEELLGFGASYLLAKPFPTEELSRAVDSILQ